MEFVSANRNVASVSARRCFRQAKTQQNRAPVSLARHAGGVGKTLQISTFLYAEKVAAIAVCNGATPRT
jgi:hypothetical protein